ncbi:retrovirus-related pol polyprotein from transposon TNT 1-94 [Tanacetum coccineum]|uniref:Retrovirus-related pol polyprotein from transposon TNT 1-94 n=1 Tax=Tanacetum coccineum TaxID=301880 RepID=A0ABQ4XCF4_9ASTR
MTTLAEFMILSGADNRPLMLDKDLYDSWKSIMELYMQNIEHGRMILESVERGPLIWPTIKENYVTRTTKYEELSATEKIQVDCDLKATNIILQGLPSDVYSLVNHHRVAKDLWEIIQLLMQGTSLTKHERECKLYDAFDKFAHIKEESLYQYYLRFTQLINDMNIYKMKIEQFQVNTKFLNNLSPEWNFGLAVHVFKHGDDPVDAINKTMSFLSTVITYRFLTTNNQLRNSSNPRQQITIHDGRVTVQSVQGRQSSFAFGTSGTRANISGTGGNNSGQQRVVKCFNYQWEGHMARQCPKPKRKKDATWFWDKVLLVKAQGYGKVLNEEELAFLADPRVAEGPVTQTIITHNAAYQADNLDAYDSDCDDFSTVKAVLMSKLSSYGSDVLSEENELLTEIFNVLKNESNEKETKNIDKEITLEKNVKELDNIVYKMGQSAQTVHMLTKPQVFYDNNLKQALSFQNPFYLKKAQQIRPMLYDGSVIAKETNVISITDSEEILMLEEESRSKMLLK